MQKSTGQQWNPQFQPSIWNQVICEAVKHLNSAHPTNALFLTVAVGNKCMNFMWDPNMQTGQPQFKLEKDSPKGSFWQIDRRVQPLRNTRYADPETLIIDPELVYVLDVSTVPQSQHRAGELVYGEDLERIEQHLWNISTMFQLPGTNASHDEEQHTAATTGAAESPDQDTPMTAEETTVPEEPDGDDNAKREDYAEAMAATYGTFWTRYGKSPEPVQQLLPQQMGINPQTPGQPARPYEELAPGVRAAAEKDPFLAAYVKAYDRRMTGNVYDEPAGDGKIATGKATAGITGEPDAHDAVVEDKSRTADEDSKSNL
ncbi:hypothetical protein M011DRAFT_481131 [Sporormia fimetaria CBS 119925]|uniref:Uncharacterized protein n=1 Tax=Sporormia fimetaria CBS 119925 TaxID=1340428 RepID=A0A6A6V018_9PLEO|nr:hypothetical protein M011DRAFT_481131 [Sporormia fimetaria CBS 119925]